jgi:hypothetical protein
MADHPHTIDRWGRCRRENLIEQIAAVGDYLVALATYARIYDLEPTEEKGTVITASGLRNVCPTPITQQQHRHVVFSGSSFLRGV